MLEILAITTPIFTLIGMGYLAVRLNIYPKAHLSALGAFVIRIALPVLVFKSISQRSFAEVMNFPYLGAYLFGSLLMLGVDRSQQCGVRRRFSGGLDQQGRALFAAGGGQAGVGETLEQRAQGL